VIGAYRVKATRWEATGMAFSLREENAPPGGRERQLRTERVEYHEPWWPGAEGVLAGSGYDGRATGGGVANAAT
jgi:hypothetical protein